MDLQLMKFLVNFMDLSHSSINKMLNCSTPIFFAPSSSGMALQKSVPEPGAWNGLELADDWVMVDGQNSQNLHWFWMIFGR